MKFLSETLFEIIKQQYAFLSKSYQIPYALYFVEPYDNFILNKEKDFFLAVQNKDKIIYSRILSDIEEYLKEKIQIEIDLSLQNKKISFYSKRIQTLNKMKIILKWFF